MSHLLSTSDELNELAEIFKQMNTKNDGLLSIEDLKVGLRQPIGSFYYKNIDWDDILISIDSNNDGFVDFSEFVSAAFNRQKLINKENLQTAFKIFDKDGDGQITKEEMKSVFSGGIA